ncbi:MAG: hypothetical protein J1D77_01260 [Muribaculaceae bacterium]|nr:hypothetical protein [Muribaculaceae bacterium]
MRKDKGLAFILLAGLFFMSLATGCTSGNDEEAKMPYHKEGNITVRLNILPVSTRLDLNSSVAEMIQSLRVIILDLDEGEVEENYYVKLNGLEAKPVANFQYFYTFVTKSGNKRLYLIANEESVEDISYKAPTGVTLPQELPDNLPELLNSYQPGDKEDPVAIGNIMNSLYFTPSYSADETGSIFIPYVSTYEEEIKEVQPTPGVVNELVEWTTYLVPVATKFTFTFNNYRESGVEIGGINMSYYHPDSYLFAHVGSDDITKTFNDETLYWVDWLAKVSEESGKITGSSQNGGFNTQYGWISDYEIPTDNYQSYVFVAPTDSFVVDGAQQPDNEDEDIIPTTVNVGPFYITESKNTLNPKTQTSSEAQIYSLTITLTDLNPAFLAPDFVNEPIVNLKSLFRNTSVIIRLNMTQGDVEVYAEVADWNREAVNGWLEKGDPPTGLPQ